MTTIRPMQPVDKKAVLAMMEVFYASPAVLSNGSTAIFTSDFEACVTFALSDGAGDFLSPEMVHLHNVAALRDEFATVVSAQQVLEEYV